MMLDLSYGVLDLVDTELFVLGLDEGLEGEGEFHGLAGGILRKDKRKL